jgi:HSP20 family molecular chaperone IbpA
MTKNATGQAAKGDVVMIVPPQAIVGRMDQIRAMIAKRAYEFYERRGMKHGGDLDDWAQAEREVLHPCRHDLRESEEEIILRAEIPGSYKSSEVAVCIGPRTLIVIGERTVDATYWDGKETLAKAQPQRILRLHELPAEVDPSRSTAFLKKEILTVTMPKADASHGAVQERTTGAAQ